MLRQLNLKDHQIRDISSIDLFFSVYIRPIFKYHWRKRSNPDKWKHLIWIVIKASDENRLVLLLASTFGQICNAAANNLARIDARILSYVIFSAVAAIVFLLSSKPAQDNKSHYVGIKFDRNLFFERPSSNYVGYLNLMASDIIKHFRGIIEMQSPRNLADLGFI